MSYPAEVYTPYRLLAPESHPLHLVESYSSSVSRAPAQPFIRIPQTLTELTGPVFTADELKFTSDLTQGHQGQPLGERIVVHGKVMDENGKPVPHTLVEIWQANAAGRYLHKKDQHHAPLDPNFSGAGQVLTDSAGNYRFITIKPGAYPWGNHKNAWRPMHIHFSLFGPCFATRLVTQMYFPGDPLLSFDPIFHSVRTEQGRNRLISSFDWDATLEGFALGYCFNIVLRGKEETPFEEAHF